ncbi:MAG: phosphatidate cytidylyltransferase [Lachnospiraceae bacterium]|nr:phosphatidate cytidylyltransferase [Lachnospiraceae bacterium]
MFITRTISGIVLMILIISGIVAGGPVWLVATGLLSVVATYELLRVLKLNKSVIMYAALIADILLYVLLYMKHNDMILMLTVAYFLVVMTIYVVRWPKYESVNVAYGLFAFVYAGLCISYLYQIRALTDGIYYMWLVFISSWGSDTCAYVVGMLFGKHKLSSTLSPKKSIEGCIGGVGGAAILAAIYGLYLMNALDDGRPLYIMFAGICAVGSIMSQIGDLAASAVKRNNNIKDYGKLIPGHGGIMDRFDSVMYVAPVVYYVIVLITG